MIPYHHPYYDWRREVMTSEWCAGATELQLAREWDFTVEHVRKLLRDWGEMERANP